MLSPWQAVSRFTLFPLVAALAIFAGCGGDEASPGDGGGNGGTGGAGGSIQEPIVCEEDCAAIVTDACQIAVCNDGSHPGEIGACVVIAAADGTSCDDGLFCTTGDVCEAGVCQGEALDCGEGDACSEMICDEEVDSCVARPINEGQACDDGLFCTVGDICVEGSCEGQAPRDCGEGTECLAMACDESLDECVETPQKEGESCDDGLFCTVGETCQAGVCTGGAPNDCGQGDPGQCQAIACDEASETCEAVAADEGQRCDTGNLCEIHGSCQAGVCAGIQKNCAAWDSACTTGACDPLTGQCYPEPGPAGVACGDATGCTEGVCEADGNCRLTFAEDGAVCDPDGSGADTGTCLAGSCFHGAPCGGGVVFDFSDCNTHGWALTGAWECGAPASGPNAAFTGVNVLATDLDSTYPRNVGWGSNTATSPWIDLAGLATPRVTMWAWSDTEGRTYDGWNLQISTDGKTWAAVEEVDPAYPLTVSSQPAWGGPSAGYQEYTADLGAWAGQRVQIRFDMRTDGSGDRDGIYVDHVIVADAGSSPLKIGEVTPDNVMAGNPWFFHPPRVGGGTRLRWSIVDGENHGWIVLDTASGALAGYAAPGDAGKVRLTLRAEDAEASCNYDEQGFEFLVSPVPAFADGFETCGGWNLGGDWACGRPTSGPGAAAVGRNALATNLSGNYGNDRTWGAGSAISPEVDLTDGIEPVLRFQGWMETESGNDGWNVKVSEDGGATWALVTPVEPAYTHTIAGEQAWSGGATAWRQYELDLAAYAGKRVKLRFDFASNDASTAAGVYVDELVVLDRTADPLSITSTTIPQGFINEPWTATIERAGGSQGARFEIVGGTNHEWMQIDAETGELSGTPPAIGEVEVRVRVHEPTEPWNDAEATFAMRIFSLVYREDFADCSTHGWALTGDWACGVPTSGPNVSPTGTNVVATNLSGNYASNVGWGTETVTSIPIDLSGATAPVAEIDAWYNTEGSSWDGWNLQISTNGTDFAPLTSVEPAYPLTVLSQPAWGGVNENWHVLRADLSAWAGQTIWLRFDYRTDGGTVRSGVYVDAVTIID